ncbi:MAG: hypothetical protein A3I26_03695 [Candidatus Yanofskybacteria bacterium RIFCSPLOWO2_02_FULL_43_10]|uniref:VTT domain-containing protein n=1 Tax=Candidatus Yanofskybacteria bacterium RIFCSPLOWO2_12_FULL_43_11b TaxID=1802710 RepID=A0A1F8H9S2_9BACT|nr:MAG: hypothetical protein A2742_02310 [Candidatus Yanofskybacteria bacterium RIFCSPHIGHO2_01_FULL_43_32]OGN11529.1 MAG: hypothetical protein A3C69_03650 [Candidatus Yanofskybacteria bacterium RIFCSPHIGHO2_02_FULL_43_12]OGN24865.1 MAG: hypothetical protein A2923_01130 [Candidatus Yanofskybacteria bacterium RIFCSPLOWO2_01_FULL_43_46]OGN29603.1 MAG: hypothetical protein A3I26_03695 [Candidatus Yanofskybacteria bacterium RIFCSPLOWO2_02_FULL_43_10]OGN34345.1 MAG: hypothetical protein A3G51_00325 
MINIITQISEFALNIIGRTGYAGVFLLSALESAAIPIPSEVVVPFSGFLAVSGRFNIWLIILAATAANLAGSVILFWIGRSGGRWFLERYGKYVLIHKRDLEKGDRWFSRYGNKAIFWSRMLPVVRTFISLPAGVSGINFSKFCFLTFLGSLPWNAALAVIGYKAGENWNILHAYFRKADMFIAASVVLAVGWYVWKHLKNKNA